MFSRLLLVAGGSSLGAVIRWAAVELVYGLSARWVTLLLNIFGSFLLGLILGWAAARSRPSHPNLNHQSYVGRVTLGAGVGFCGGLTSFSSFAVDVAELLQAGLYPAAWLTTVLTVIGATTVASTSYHLARSLL